MGLLSIFDSGALWLVLTLIGWGLAGWFFYRAWKGSKSGSKQQTPKGTAYSDENISIFKSHSFWYGVVILLAWAYAMFSIASDYRPV